MINSMRCPKDQCSEKLRHTSTTPAPAHSTATGPHAALQNACIHQAVAASTTATTLLTLEHLHRGLNCPHAVHPCQLPPGRRRSCPAALHIEHSLQHLVRAEGDRHAGDDLHVFRHESAVERACAAISIDCPHHLHPQPLATCRNTAAAIASTALTSLLTY